MKLHFVLFCLTATGLALTTQSRAEGSDDTSYSVEGKTTVEIEAPPPALLQRVVVSDTQIKTLQPVYFRSGGADALPESLPVLDAVAEVLLKHAAIHLLRIEAHTDSVAGKNVEISQRRANWVRTYLIKKGVEPARLVARGFGASKPIASNATREGRQVNRRVEFVIGE
jgi:outer membrane protein OmpA-like peptidoglycan-associated protein